jgi:hypothetical protein
MDYVYICRAGSNEELRYSIRSVVAYANYNKIWVIGNKPDWYIGDYVHVPDSGGKFHNIVSCTKAITEIEEISDDFVLMNDDFFFLKPVGDMPTYHGGSLREKANKYVDLGSKRYGTLLLRTYNNLVKQDIRNPIDYDIHLPMPMNKQKLKNSIDKAYFPRSGYGNINNVGGVSINDVKIYSNKSPLSNRSYDFKNGKIPFISTEDDSFKEIYDAILKDLFIIPSQYEAM